MLVCYVDEAGCTGMLPLATSDIQPVFVILGLAVEQSKLKSLTEGVLLIKQQFFPHAMPKSAPLLERILVEVKGADLRKDLRTGNAINAGPPFAFWTAFSASSKSTKPAFSDAYGLKVSECPSTASRFIHTPFRLSAPLFNGCWRTRVITDS